MRDRLARLRAEWRTAERERNRVGMVLAALTAHREAVDRGEQVGSHHSLSAAFEGFGPADGETDRRETLSYLTVPLARPGDENARTAFDRIRSTALTVDASAFVDALAAYVTADGDWAAVTAAFESVLAAARRGSRTDAVALLDDLVTVFEVATEAALAYRDDRLERVNEVVKPAYVDETDPVADLDGQPVALLPVRLETRFVGSDDDSDAATDELRIRVYPDQIHVDSHEPELTDDEVHWGRTFWTRTWLACHKQVDRWDGAGGSDATWIPPDPEAVPAEFRTLVADLDPADFQPGEAGYREIKTAAWRQLVDRFSTERAGWVVRATAPETVAEQLLGGPMPGSEPAEIPALLFPPVDRRPSSWTSQPRARLLPDRWVASLAWRDADGDGHTRTVVGPAIREPLPVGPSPEGVSTWRRDGEAADAVDPDADAPPGMEWMVDYAEAAAAGMALTVDLSELPGFDAERGFTRVVVLGARGSTDADAGAERLAALLEAHHYTDGLAVLPQGTATNVFDEASGYSSADNPAESVDRVAGPPSVTPEDGTDGDRLARAFGFTVDEDDRHVFGRVANADGTEQRDARYANSALWPATIGYFLQHLLVPNEWVTTDSLWEEGGGDTLSTDQRRARLEALLPWVEAYRDHFVEYVRARGPLPAIRVGTQPYGVLPTGALEPATDPTVAPGSDPDKGAPSAALPVDGRVPADLAGWLRRFESTWAGAVEELPWTTGDLDDETLVGILQREGLSHDVVTRRYLTAGSRSELATHRAGIRETLLTHDMTELDPRLVNLRFAGLSSSVGGTGRTPIDGDGGPLASVETIAPSAFVDDDAARTIEALVSRPPDAVRKLGVDLDAETRRAVLAAMSPSASNVSDSDVDVTDVVDRMLDDADDLDPATTGQIEEVLEAVEAAIDDGADDPLQPDSLLEVLLYYATMHAYLNARVRLGTRVDDHGVLAPDPLFYLPSPIPQIPGDSPYHAALEDTVPEELTAHPAVASGDSYGDALFEGAVGSAGPTSLEPRLSEFADSLSYLADRPPSVLATAMVESLDLASHRLDAWWTSLSTRRLAELRDRQAHWEPTVDGYDEWVIDGDRSSGDDGPADAGDGEGAATSDDERATDRLDGAEPSSPGIHVGAYGFVEDLAADPPETDGEYVHAPSLQHATTASLLRSGYLAHADDSMEDALTVDLSADRVREALGLVYGVRDGQSLGEQLGYRFERGLVDHTVADGAEVNVRQYRNAFREAFPAGQPSNSADTTADAEAAAVTGDPGDAATRDVVDGYALVREWEEYPFGRNDLPSQDGDEFAVLQSIVSELADALDAVGDLLTAESVHQLGKGNFERTAASVDALAAGTTPPNPDVVRTPRDGIGVTHRSVVLFGDPRTQTTSAEWPTSTPVPITDYPAGHRQVDPDAAADAGPSSVDGSAEGASAVFQVRSEAEPALDAWIGDVLPAPADVEFRATYRWPIADDETTIDTDDGTPGPQHVVDRTVTLDELALGPLDLLALGEAGDRAAGSEFEARAAYYLRRDRPANDPPIPADATVEVATTETGRDDAVPVADLLAAVRSLRELVFEGRAVDGTDLAHPPSATDPGYTQECLEALRDRADAAEATLASVRAGLENRLAVLNPPGEVGSLLSQLDDVATATDAFVDRVPVDRLVDASGDLTGDLEADLETLAGRLADRDRTRTAPDEQVLVTSAPAQTVNGQLRVRASSPVDPGGTRPVESERGESGLPAAGRHRRLRALAEIEGFDSLLAETPAEADLRAHEGTEGTASGEPVPDRFRNADVVVLVWSRPTSRWFERGVTTTSDERGVFDVTVDFSDVEPGTSFAVVAAVEGEVAFAEHGRVVDDGDRRETAADGVDSRTIDATNSRRIDGLADAAPLLARLLWLDEQRTHLAVGDGADSTADDLATALGATRWQSAREERDLFDPSWSTLTRSDLAATDALLELAAVDPTDTDAAVAALFDGLDGMGVTRALAVAGDATAPDSPHVQVRQREFERAVRNRIRRYLSNPVAFNREVDEALLGYSPVAALSIARTDDPVRLAGYLRVFLDQPAMVVFGLGEHVDEPHRLLAAIGAWLYRANRATESPDADAVVDALGELADAVAEMPSLDGLFAIFEREQADDDTGDPPAHRRSFARLLGQLGDDLAESPPAVPEAADERAAAEGAFADAVTDYQRALADTVVPLRTASAAAAEPAAAATAFRHGVLESARVPLVHASYFGVYGSTPQSATGGTAADEATLRSQLGRVRDRVDDRLAAAAEVAPGGTDSIDRAVRSQATRLRALFGDEFVVLPPFVPSDGTELGRTFGNERLLDAGSPLAAETWLQRVAQVHDRQATFREALSAAEALSGRLVRDLTVGQLPHRPGDDWVGIDGVTPEPGQLSLVAQFGRDLHPTDLAGPICGLFVDDHVEQVPTETETTGLAINYDEPDNRAPQSILLAVPPAAGAWTIDDLESAIRETIRLSKFRAVDLEDLPHFGHLLPMLAFAYNTGSPPETPSIDFETLVTGGLARPQTVAPSYRVFSDYDLHRRNGGDR